MSIPQSDTSAPRDLQRETLLAHHGDQRNTEDFFDKILELPAEDANIIDRALELFDEA